MVEYIKKEITKEIEVNITIGDAYGDYAAAMRAILKTESHYDITLYLKVIRGGRLEFLRLRRLDRERLNVYKAYLTGKYSTGTAIQYISRMHTFLKWCRLNGYPIHDDIAVKSDRSRPKPKPAIRLTDRDIRLIEAWEPHNERWEDYKEWLLLALDGGLRPVDLMNVHKGEITRDASGIALSTRNAPFKLTVRSVETCRKIIKGTLYDIPPKSLPTKFKDVCRYAKVDGWERVTGRIGFNTFRAKEEEKSRNRCSFA